MQKPPSPWPCRRGALLLALLAACTSAPRLSLADRRAIFHDAWQTIAEKHFDATMGGVDWQAVRTKYAPAVDAARDEDELLAVLHRMTGELHHSHVAVLPPDQQAAPPTRDSNPASTVHEYGAIGLRAAWLDDRIVVTHTDPEGAAAAAGIRPGDELVAIAGERTEPLVARARARGGKSWSGFVPYLVAAMLHGDVDAPVSLDVAAPGSTVRRVTATRQRPEMAAMALGNLGTLAAEFETRQLGGNVLYVRFSPCFTPLQQRLEAALEHAPDAAGVILDLRDNPGGLGALAMGVARHFLQEEQVLGTMRLRGASEPLRFQVNPDDAPYRGPVVLVVNAATGSTAEILAAGLQKLGRVRIVGETSMGAALPSVIEKIACNWRVQAVVADFTLPDGTSVEGIGVVPDVAVAPTRADFAAGRDPFVDAALRELANAPRLGTPSVPSAPAAAAPSTARPPCEMNGEMAELYAHLDADPSAVLLRAARTLRITSHLDVMGMGGPSVTTIQPPDRIHAATSMAGIGDLLQVYDGTQAWSRTPFDGLRELLGEELHAFGRSARLDTGAWREQFATVEIVERRLEGDRAVIVLRQTPHEGEGQPILMTLDAATLLPWRTETTVRTRTGPIKIATEIVEYATFAGIVMPKKSIAVTVRATASGRCARGRQDRGDAETHLRPVDDPIPAGRASAQSLVSQ